MSEGGGWKSGGACDRDGHATVRLRGEESRFAGDGAEEIGDFGALAGGVEDAEAQNMVASAVGFEGGEEGEGAEFQVPGFGARAGGPALLLEEVEEAMARVVPGAGEGKFSDIADVIAVDVFGFVGFAEHGCRTSLSPAVERAEAGGKPVGDAEEEVGARFVEFVGEGSAGEDVGGEGLVGGGAEWSVVDDVVITGGNRATGVNGAFPADAGEGEPMGMRIVEEGFGMSVAELLFHVAGEGGASAVPDEGAGGKGEFPVVVDEAPANVDVVTGGAELFAESADAVEGAATDGEVAAGEVFGAGVVEEDVGRCTGSGGDDGFLQALGFGREVWSASSTDGWVVEGSGQPEEPVAVGFTVVVGVGDDVAFGFGGTAVSGDGEAEVFLPDEADVREAIDDVGGVVGGAVVDDEDFEVWVVDALAGAEAGLEATGAVVGANDDGEEGGLGEGEEVAVVLDLVLKVGELFEGGLGVAIAAGEAEAPVVDGAAVDFPLVGPGEDGGTGDAGFEAFLDLGGEQVGLF